MSIHKSRKKMQDSMVWLGVQSCQTILAMMQQSSIAWTKIATRWWLLKYVLFSPRNLGEMIQFDEHIFQLGWFNHQLATTSSAACLDIFVRFRSPWHRPLDTQTDRLLMWLEARGTGNAWNPIWKMQENLSSCWVGNNIDWNFTSLSDHQYQYLFPEPPELCAWKILLPDFCSPIFENQFSKKKRMKL